MDGLYNNQVTIVNKLKKADSGIGATTDTYVKTVIKTAEYRKKTVRNVSGSTVSLGEVETVLIPFKSGYLPYNEWKADTSKGFTMNPGDIIFYHSLTEVPTASSIASLKALYDNCDVRTVLVAKDNGVAKVQLMIEGV